MSSHINVISGLNIVFCFSLIPPVHTNIGGLNKSGIHDFIAVDFSVQTLLR